MKKKMMIMAAFLSALTLGSCIDDTESQSVTNIRDSKAEELKSIAAMESAQAQAKLTLANAEATLLAAQAQAETAKAAKTQAQAALETAEAELIALQKEAAEIQNEADRIANEAAQVELEAKLAQLEVTKKQNEAELERIAAETELQALQNQKLLVEAQKALKEAEENLAEQLANADAAEKERLQNLADAYKEAVENLIDQQNRLLDLKADLVSLETGYADAKATAEKDIENYNNQIAYLKLQNETYKQYTNYIEDMDAAKQEVNSLALTTNKLCDDYYAKNNAFGEVTVDLTELNEMYNELRNDSLMQFFRNFYVYYTNTEGQKVSQRINRIAPFQNYYPYQNSDNKAEFKSYQKTMVSFENENYGIYSSYTVDSLALDNVQVPTEDLRMIELEVNDRLETLTGWLENNTKNLKEAQAQYDGEAKYATGTYDENGDMIYKKGLNAVDSTAYLHKAWQDLAADTEATEEKINEAKEAYQTQLNIELNLKNQITRYQSNVNNYTNQITYTNTAWQLVQDIEKNKEALQVKIDAYNEAVLELYKEKATAWLANVEAYVAYKVAYDAYDAKRQMIYDKSHNPESAAAITEKIADNEQSIKFYDSEIEKLAVLTSHDLQYGTKPYEELIAYYKAKIEAQEAVVAAAETAANTAKAELDAVMPETEAAE